MKSFFYQNPKGYCYNSDSIFLFSFIRQFKLKGNVLDIGCGVGVLSVLLAKEFKANFYAIEKQKIMYEYALKNINLNKLNINLILNDFLEYNFKEKFDFVISNPPFYKADKHQSSNEIINIARYEHHLPINKFITKVSKILKPRGYFIFCYDAKHSAEVIYNLQKEKMQVELIRYVYPKIDKEANIILIAARKSSKANVKVMPPLIVFNESNKYTKEAKEIFLTANTHSIKAIL